MAKKHSTNIHFDHDLWEWLKQESQRRRASISQIVRELVVREMESQKDSK